MVFSGHLPTLTGLLPGLFMLLLRCSTTSTTNQASTMGYITGIVRDTTNAPLEDVNMLIVSGPPHPDIVAVTDTEGRFGFENLRPGRYVLKAYGRLESDEIPVQVRANQPPFVEIWLGSAPAPPTPDSAEESYLINEVNGLEEEGYQREE